MTGLCITLVGIAVMFTTAPNSVVVGFKIAAVGIVIQFIIDILSATK